MHLREKIDSMKKSLFFILISIFYTYTSAQVSEITASRMGLTLKQEALIQEKAKLLPNKAQLSIALIKKGELSFYGIKRENDTSLRIHNYTDIFEIGSITKVFTGALLANLVQKNKIKLDDPIHKFLDFSLKNEVEISFKQLATHTSGLPRIPGSLYNVSLENPYKDFGEDQLETYLSEKLEMAAVPGEKCEYSNLGVGLLGYVLGKIEGDSFEELLQQNIFSRYQMNSSSTIRTTIENRLIKGLNDQGEEVSNWDMAVHMGAGGILSSVEDLSKFALAQFDKTNKELELTRTGFFTVSENYSMGLAWGLIKRESGAIWNWHNGGTGGYTSSMIIDTQAQHAVIILSNVSALGDLTGHISGLSPILMDTLYEE